MEQAPFFIVFDGTREVVYISVLELACECFEASVSAQEQAALDVDDIGGI